MDDSLIYLETLADASRLLHEARKRDRHYGNGELGRVEEDFETELVRAEDYLEEVKRNADI